MWESLVWLIGVVVCPLAAQRVKLVADAARDKPIMRHGIISGIVWLNVSVVSAFGIRARFQVVPLFHWAANLGKLFTHIASPSFSAPRNWGYKKGFRRLIGYNNNNNNNNNKLPISVLD